MIKEAIQHVQELSSRLDLMTCEEIPEQVFYKAEGKVFTLKAPPARRRHEVDDLGSILRAAKDPKMAVDPEVYHATGGVTLLLDRADRRDYVRMRLHTTRRFERLAGLQKPAELDPKAAYLLLRYDLDHTGLDRLMIAVRRLHFTKKSSAEFVIGQGQDSLGRSAEAGIMEQIDDEFVARVPVYDNPGCDGERSIRVGVFVDADAQKIHLMTLPDEINKAVLRAQDDIAMQLSVLEIPTFHGTP